MVERWLRCAHFAENEAIAAQPIAAARTLLDACETSDVEAATREVEFALFMGGKLVLSD